MIVVVMGVSGSGKSTVGAALARASVDAQVRAIIDALFGRTRT
jgi:adenylate kinase family enzyme